MDRRRFLIGSTAAATSAIAAPALVRAATEITFYYPVAVGGPITKTIDGYAADFEKENPGISVKPIYAGTYQETMVKALTAHKSGNPPTTCVLLSTDMFSLIDEETIVPFDDFARSDAEKNWIKFARYFLNTFVLVTLILSCQLILCTLAAYAFARFAFVGRDLAFALVLVQLMIMPDVLIVENYRTMSWLGLVDTIPGIALPYVASAFDIFLLRQTFKSVPRELDDVARVEGAGPLQVLWRVYVPLAKPVYLAYALVSVSYHWNNFLWPLIVTNSVEARPLTVGLQVFASTDQGIDWSVICAATLMTSAPLLVGFLLFQRQFVQSFMRAGIR